MLPKINNLFSAQPSSYAQQAPTEASSETDKLVVGCSQDNNRASFRLSDPTSRFRYRTLSKFINKKEKKYIPNEILNLIFYYAVMQHLSIKPENYFSGDYENKISDSAKSLQQFNNLKSTSKDFYHIASNLIQYDFIIQLVCGLPQMRSLQRRLLWNMKKQVSLYHIPKENMAILSKSNVQHVYIDSYDIDSYDNQIEAIFDILLQKENLLSIALNFSSTSTNEQKIIFDKSIHFLENIKKSTTISTLIFRRNSFTEDQLSMLFEALARRRVSSISFDCKGITLNKEIFDRLKNLNVSELHIGNVDKEGDLNHILENIPKKLRFLMLGTHNTISIEHLKNLIKTLQFSEIENLILNYRSQLVEKESKVFFENLFKDEDILKNEAGIPINKNKQPINVKINEFTLFTPEKRTGILRWIF